MEGAGSSKTTIYGEVFAKDVVDAKICHLKVADNKTSGIHCYSSTITVANCTISDQPDEGILCLQGSKITITDCKITNNGHGAIRAGKSSLCEVYRNRLFNNGYSGVDIFGNSSAIISRNTINNNGKCGIYITNSSATIKNNIIFSYPLDGISCKSSSGNIINSTIAKSSHNGIISWDSVLSVENNIVVNNTQGGIAEFNTEWDIRYNDVWGNCLNYSQIPDEIRKNGNISVDPLFLDPDNDDYHLKGWSPCVDAGDPNSDYSNEPEPNGDRINMGAYGNTEEAATTRPEIGTSTGALVEDKEVIYSGKVSLQATLTTEASEPIADEILIFKVNNKDIGTAATNQAGVATVPYTYDLPVGIYKIKVIYG